MFKVLIWDYMGVSAQWLEKVIDKKYVEVIGTITPQESVPEILFKSDEWDWLLIFERGMRNFFDSAVRVSKLPPDKVIYALDMNSWIQHYKAAFMLTNPVAEGQEIFLRMNLAINQQLGNFVTCTVDGVSYVATSKDSVVMGSMYTTRKNYAEKTMKIFYSLAKKYYNVDDSAGYFLDLGANIGTTGIYFLKKFTPNLKLLAFEPDAENFKLLRTNLILNDLEDSATVVNCGLGEESSEMTMYRNLFRPNTNTLFKRGEDMPTATIKIIALDDYLAENKIAAEEVKYIWIDTEGFEAKILLGAKNLLAQNPVPIFTECNLGSWDETGAFEPMMKLLAENYSHFVFAQGDTDILYPLEDLRKIKRPNNPQGMIGDIFLIRKGAIV